MFGGKFNLDNLMKNAKKMQDMMQEAQAELAKIEVNGESGAGLVKVTLNAQHELKALNLSDELLEEDKGVIEELITAAFNDATQKVTQMAEERIMSGSQLFGGGSDHKDDSKGS